MLRNVLKLRLANGIKVDENAKRFISYGRIRAVLTEFFEPRPMRPYIHACQVGDPVLRARAEPVEKEKIKTPEFRRTINQLISVMRIYKAMGLSAPQIGLSQQIFVLEVTKYHMDGFNEDYRRTHGMELTPLLVFINPKMKIVDSGPVRDSEECLSVLGYSAIVSRAKTVRIEALDISGEPFTWQADGWSARIVQHEMDHLEGKLYIDRMDSTTFSCIYWSNINARRGNMGLQFYPRHWLRRFLQL